MFHVKQRPRISHREPARGEVCQHSKIGEKTMQVESRHPELRLPARTPTEWRPHLPMQKSRKITSRTSSTSTRPVSRPSARAASRNSSASRSSASRPAHARRKAAAASSSARRCRAREINADSAPANICSAWLASADKSASTPSPVFAEILNIVFMLLFFDSFLSRNAISPGFSGEERRFALYMNKDSFFRFFASFV